MATSDDYAAEIQQAAQETHAEPTGNVVKDAKQRRENTAALVERTREIEKRAAADDPSGPSQSDLNWINEKMGVKDENGKSRYFTDSKYRERLEHARAKVFRGESIRDFRANSDADLAGKPRPDAQPSQPAVDPNASPADQLISRIEQGDVIGLDELPDNLRSEFTAGYNVRLPDGYGLTAADSADLQAARAAGLSQAQVDKIIADRLKS